MVRDFRGNEKGSEKKPQPYSQYVEDFFSDPDKVVAKVSRNKSSIYDRAEYMFHGILLVDKPTGISSFEVLRRLKGSMKLSKKIKMGHGGTLDPFASGLLIVMIGKAVKLAGYFLGTVKTYQGIMKFGVHTYSGDMTFPVLKETDQVPASLDALRQHALEMAEKPYFQIPPMISAKKKFGKPLYQWAREGIELPREPKECRLLEFDIQKYEKPCATFIVKCSSGTYVRTLVQDFADAFNTVGVLQTLARTQVGEFLLHYSMKMEEVVEAIQENKPLSDLACWIPMEQLLLRFGKSTQPNFSMRQIENKSISQLEIKDIPRS